MTIRLSEKEMDQRFPKAYYHSGTSSLYSSLKAICVKKKLMHLLIGNNKLKKSVNE
jgi:hypothetical protein